MAARKYRLEDVAEQLKVPTTTVISWLGEGSHSARWEEGRWYLAPEAVESLQERGGWRVREALDKKPSNDDT